MTDRMRYTEWMKYVAFLRGIGPGNPNMTNDKLRSVFESLGFDTVKSVISSGNIIFTTEEQNEHELEKMIQQALVSQLGIAGGTIVRSESELRTFLALDPFRGYVHSRTSYLTVTFLKDRSQKPTMEFPVDRGDGSQLLLYNELLGAICAVTDTTNAKAPSLMVWIEKQFSKDITTRTWKTLERIVAKF